MRKAGIDAASSGRPSTGIAVLKVPARPFIAPVFDKYAADAEQVLQSFLKRVATYLGGQLGDI